MAFVYRILADIVVTAHVAYVAFVVLGLVAIWYGIIRKRAWARSRALRYSHLAMILIVVAEAWIGMTCPLTIWEQRLRAHAGEAAYQGDFIANWLHELLFFDAAPWVFTVVYTAFGLLVLATFFVAPPRPRVRTPTAA